MLHAVHERCPATATHIRKDLRAKNGFCERPMIADSRETIGLTRPGRPAALLILTNRNSGDTILNHSADAGCADVGGVAPAHSGPLATRGTCRELLINVDAQRRADRDVFLRRRVR
jgi:hypothetical protein